MGQPERYYVRESSGYTISLSGQPGGGQGRPITEVLVLDRDLCHRVVWSSVTTVTRKRYANGIWAETTSYQRPLSERRAIAAELAARLNAEDASDAA
jgi:hypothetical protein